MIEQAKKLFVVEYSITQNATHIRSVGGMLKNNMRNIVKNSSTDYVPIALFDTRSKAEIFVIEIHNHLEAEFDNNWQHISEVLHKLLSNLESDWRRK